MYPQNIKVAVDMLVFSKTGGNLQILLVKRKNDPYKGMWAFPGGFVEDGEELEDAAIRELKEETSIELNGMAQLHAFGKVGRDSRGRTVSIVHYAFVDAEAYPLNAGDDAAEARWVKLKDITTLAFDHNEILDFALQQLASDL